MSHAAHADDLISWIERKINPPPATQTVWILADNRIGSVNQCRGIAEHLPYVDVVEKPIRYGALAQLPNFFLGTSLLGLTTKSRKDIQPPWPDLVIAAGRRAATVARYIKHASDDQTKLVQLMWPGNPVYDFDLIVVPQHDRVPRLDHVMMVEGAPHRLTETLIAEEAKQWEARFKDLPKPWCALLVGGTTKYGVFSAADAGKLADLASEMMEHLGGSLLVTTSRRTPPDAEAALKQHIRVPCYFHDWRSKEANPYPGLLGLAKAVIVTGDSMSMCTEACFTGRPVFIYAEGASISNKYRRFHDVLYRKGYARPLEGQFESFSYRPLDVAGKVAREIEARLFGRDQKSNN